MSHPEQIEWFVSGEKMTLWVMTDNWRMIIDCAPIARKFIGQPLANLTRWMGKNGGVKVERLKNVVSDLRKNNLHELRAPQQYSCVKPVV